MIIRRLHSIRLLSWFAGMAVASLATVASAQSTTKQMDGMKLSNDKPIQIQSDQLEIKDQEKKAFFTGNVEVVQGTTTMKAAKMTVLYKGDAAGSGSGGGSSMTSGQQDIDKIFVSGKVFLNSGTQTATGDEGEYDMASQMFTLTGSKVVLTDGPNVLTGCKLIVHVDTGEAKLDNCGKRIEIMLDPKSKPKQ
ncbi:LptA/OstA family protein [Rhizobium helianthi]|uniref:LptA/OstA family protein n=1 Tax=Rhizobium helianthi TaxID=1132695 RepID=A0ABW4LZX5_9HYPH